MRPPHPRLLVISPHCDDGVFGCGELLGRNPGATVVTVFAGRPSAYPDVTPWDRAGGFGPADDPVAVRRDEDRAALAILGARPVWLDFCDAQYGPSPAVSEIAPALERVVVSTVPDQVVVPLGLFHSDHHLTREAALTVVSRQPRLTWLVYEDAIYRTIDGLTADGLTRLQSAGLFPTPVEGPAACSGPAKRRAVACYRSQLRALAGHPGLQDVFMPERYWRLA